jgi:hypothetical protein
MRGALTVAVALALFYFIYIVAAPSAFAIPEGGASPDTPGTYAEASPKELKPGETIKFSVTGYPAGEILNIKIDDGAGYSDQTTAGTGVIHTQAIGKNGSASGSFKLPGDISEGWHWLRFLASEQVEGKGVLGYTNGAGSASNTSHPTAFRVKGESVGGKDAKDSVVEGTHPGTDTATAPSGSQESAGGAATESAGDAAAGSAAQESAAVGGAANGSATKDGASGGGTASSGDGNKKTSASASVDASANDSEAALTEESAATSGAAAVADGAAMTDSEAAKAAEDAIFNAGGEYVADASVAKASGSGDASTSAFGTTGAGGLPVAGIIALAAAVAASLAAMIFAALRKPKIAWAPVEDGSGKLRS